MFLCLLGFEQIHDDMLAQMAGPLVDGVLELTQARSAAKYNGLEEMLSSNPGEPGFLLSLVAQRMLS